MTTGHISVIERRVAALQWAITTRDWQATEFACDQVRRAVAKLKDAGEEHIPRNPQSELMNLLDDIRGLIDERDISPRKGT